MSQCNHNCGSCNSNCSDRKQPADLRQPAHPQSKIKKVIGVVSGKGGVGKSMTSGMLSVVLNQRGYRTAVLDADITGPSIPKLFNIQGRAKGDSNGILPAVTKTGIQIMSVNLMLENQEDPVVWRGPIIANVVKQFWQEVIWQDVDFLFVDMPPGTGDVPLTVFQSLPIDAIVVVATPQELVGMIVAKAVKMASMMHIPMLGVVENMSYLACPDCGKQIHLFGQGKLEKVCEKYQLPLLAKVPLDPDLAEHADQGNIEQLQKPYWDTAANAILAL